MNSDIKIIKEQSEYNGKLVIRTNCYGSSFEFISGLVQEAKKDFPELEDKDIEIVKFAGQHYARTFGIEFYVKTTEIPEEYSKIPNLEYTF